MGCCFSEAGIDERVSGGIESHVRECRRKLEEFRHGSRSHLKSLHRPDIGRSDLAAIPVTPVSVHASYSGPVSLSRGGGNDFSKCLISSN